MQRAIIFDFDGVVADSEPIHLMMFQRILGEIGIFLSREEYCAAYLGYDDKGCFEAVLAAHGRPSAPAYIEELVSRKAKVMIDHLKDNLVIYPGVVNRRYQQQHHGGQPGAVSRRHEGSGKQASPRSGSGPWLARIAAGSS